MRQLVCGLEGRQDALAALGRTSDEEGLVYHWLAEVRVVVTPRSSCELQATPSRCIDWMFLHQLDLTTALRPSLLPEETLLFVQDAVGLYEGYVTARVPAACRALLTQIQQIQNPTVSKRAGLLDIS